MSDVSRVEEVYLAAVELPDPAQREKYLDATCGNDADLRRRVEKLLAAQPKVGRFLEPTELNRPRDFLAPTLPVESTAAVGDRVGPYKLLERIGEGGMGEVWVADQQEPIKRRVALKLIKPGMDSRSVLARFEAERQALAVMDHPNIAKVLDAGTTGDGHPYFVMELVKGTPITEFADSRKLTTTQRLELFVPVCQAIQHAHMKGIIHRDIKPSNVLVALHDETPVPKVIDFGVAKAIGQQLTDKTIYTGFGALVGTPTYMAPEQATFNQLDVDTRADVYALGVLLYELLAGSPPIEKERLKQAALDEVLRIVRDEEPPRPSQRLSTSHSKASIAAVRGSEPAHLSQLMRGEIDWIVMKALEKDRARRYDTATALAKDVQRYLNGDAVEACPPTLAYRFRKFASRNRHQLIVFGMVLLCLTLGIIGTTFGLFRAEQRRDEAEQARADEAIQRRIAETKRTEAEENAREANRLFFELQGEKIKGDIKTISLQIDLDILEINTDPKIGLLRLAKPRKDTSHGYEVEGWPLDHDGPVLKGTMTEPYENYPDYSSLVEFVTAAVLTIGQNYAPLLPPITHDGCAVVWHAVSPEGNRMVTLGEDGAARLWETATAKLVRILQQDGERVINCGFSPDGKTVFTDDQASVARFWNGDSGLLISKTETRPNRYEFPESWSVEKIEQEIHPKYLIGRDQKTLYRNSVQFGNGRALTSRCITELMGEDRGELSAFNTTTQYPFELWNTKTGQLIASFDGTCNLVGDGTFVKLDESDSTTIYASEDGQKVTRYKRVDQFRNEVHSSGRWVVELYMETSTQDSYFEIRDTWNWNAPPNVMKCPIGISVTDSLGYAKEILISEDLLAVHAGYFLLVGRLGVDKTLTPIRYGDGNMDWSPNVALLGEELYAGNGYIYDMRTGKKLAPPVSRKFSKDLSRFSKERRFVSAFVDSKHVLIDTLTDKCIPGMANLSFVNHVDLERLIAPRRTEVNDVYRNSVVMQMIPLSRLSEIPRDLLQLWAQVVVRGQLDSSGTFEKWDEKTWTNKQMELAMVSPPIANFPFPGQIAVDKTYWLRCEYAIAQSRAEGFQSGAELRAAGTSDKLQLASELLRHAEEGGNRSETDHWRAERAKCLAALSQSIQE
jgi:serine/threonine protein kinase